MFKKTIPIEIRQSITSINGIDINRSEDAILCYSCPFTVLLSITSKNQQQPLIDSIKIEIIGTTQA